MRRYSRAAATSYATHGLATLPFYIYYSMFGFQRFGDLTWAAADQRACGFLIGVTSGRTTLGGEGLQHPGRQQPSGGFGHSQLPRLRSGARRQLAVIVDHGMRQMLVEQADEFYYVTVTNEAVGNPSLAGLRNARVHIANEEGYLVSLDQLPSLLHAGADVVRRVLDQKLNGLAQYAAP